MTSGIRVSTGWRETEEAGGEMSPAVGRGTMELAVH